MPPGDQLSTPDLRLPFRQQSIQSLHKINTHYGEFHQALCMLKMSVEELWRLELEQLRDHKLTSQKPSNTIFDLQVPSIYTCRSVLPIASETTHLKNKISPTVESSIILHPSSIASTEEIASNKTAIKDKMIKSSIQSLSNSRKSTRSLFSISKNQKQNEFVDNFKKYWTKTALLHLKFRCSKHTH
jgi:hypothetical protein